MTESHGTPENREYPHIPPQSNHPADPTEFVGADAIENPKIGEIPTGTEIPSAAKYFDISQNIINSGVPGALPPHSKNPTNYSGIVSGQPYPGEPNAIAHAANPGEIPAVVAPEKITALKRIPAAGTTAVLKIATIVKQKLSALWQDSLKILTPWWQRFMVLMVILYVIPAALSYIPSLDPVTSPTGPLQVISRLILLPWTLLASIFLGEKILPNLNTVIADNQLGYFYLCSILIFSAIIAAIWALIERKFTHPKIDTIIKYIWKNGLRLSLAAFFIYFGMIKFIPAQMHVPWPTELAKPIGDQTAQNYFWNFMGYSPLFECIVGFIELIGGILLLIPRFITLGGYLSLGIILPITAIVFCYDIPLKIISIVTTLGTIIFLWPSITALYGYLIQHKGVRPLTQPKIITFAKTWLRRTTIIIYILLSTVFICFNLLSSTVKYDYEQLNPDLDINGRWIITGRQLTDPQLLGVLPQQWTNLDITATNSDLYSYSHFDVELDMGSILGASHMDFPALYTARYIQIGTKSAGLLPYDLAFNYVVKGDSLTLLALNADTNQPSLILTAKRATPWPHQPGEFHWIPQTQR